MSEKILSADNSVSYNANNTCEIYIIKEVDYDNVGDFENKYADLLQDSSKISKIVDLVNSSNTTTIRLTRLLSLKRDNKLKYTPITVTTSAPDAPRINDVPITELYFYSDLLELKNCPLLDFSKLYYVFQIKNKSNIFNSDNKSGLSGVVSFDATFSVNGMSSCSLHLNNVDFKYNFKYFNDRSKFADHLKPFFDYNDIVIVRMQKKNVMASDITSSFKISSLNNYQDIYSADKNDPLTTIFTGYITNINESFNYSTGSQMMELQCDGPSKKLVTTRVLSNQAIASRDSSSAIMPISAFVNPQTRDAQGRTDISNENVVTNTIVRTYSGLLSIPELKEAKENFDYYFDLNANNLTDTELQNLEKQRSEATTAAERLNIQKRINDYKTTLSDKIYEYKDRYNTIIAQQFNKFVTKSEDTGTVKVLKNTFIPDQTEVFVINGTNQPAYTYGFEKYEIFQSDFDTAYQFIKSIADNLLFNFYDDPYGVIHFSIPDITLHHLQKTSDDYTYGVSKDPNVLTQIISFSQTQDTMSIANVQPGVAQSVYGVSLSEINSVIKDYASIKKYGERSMNVIQFPGLTSTESIKYACKMLMKRYNRKAMANIRVNCQGIPDLKMDKYAYIKPLRKLFYVESYSHSYQAGGTFTTSIAGTYLRDILAEASVLNSTTINNLIENVVSDAIGLNSLDKTLKNSNSIEEMNTVFNNFSYEGNVQQSIYDLYVSTYGYPPDAPDLQKEIMSLYTNENISNCYLDGFFWSLPFDASPYETAVQLQNDERERLQRQDKIFKSKDSVKTEAKNIVSGVSNSVKNVSSEIASTVGTSSSDDSSSTPVEEAYEEKKKTINTPLPLKIGFSIVNPFKRARDFISGAVENLLSGVSR